MKEVTLEIGGMHCVMCAAAVERSLKKMDGVESASVSYASELAEVKFDESKVSEKKLSKCVKKAGYSVIENKAVYQKRQFKKLILSFVAAAVLTLPFLLKMILMFTAPNSSIMPFLKNGWFQMALASLVQFGIGWRFFIGAWDSLRAHSANMDVLITVGTMSAYIYSMYNLLTGGSVFYFEASAMVVTLVFLGKIFESRAKAKANEAVDSLLKLQPKMATVIREGKEIKVPTGQLTLEDSVVVRPGEGVAVDGEIVKGESAVDESMLTGESIPTLKKPGDKVYAGTVNKEGTFVFKVQGIGKNTMLSSIVKMVRGAQESKPPIQRTVDKVAAVFVPSIVSIALLTFLITFFVLGKDSAAMSTAVSHAVAVLVIACPCSLGLATPTALMVGTGMAAQAGILIQDAQALEMASHIDHMLLDKTGTITQGKPEVTDFVILSGEKSQVMALTAAVEKPSEHPVGQAIYRYCAQQNQNINFRVENFQAQVGKGVKALVDGKEIQAGRPENPPKELQKILQNFAMQGKTTVAIMQDGIPIAAVAVADRVKEDSALAVKQLCNQGIELTMITGDNKATADAIAKQVGVKHVEAEVLPGDKQNKVKEIKSHGGVVAMVGDGANDAPALAAADVGIAMGTGTDIAAQASSLVIMSGSLMDVARAVNLSKAILKKIRQNLFWAFIYNSIGVPLAAFGFLNPIVAGAAMAFSSVSVVTSSLFLKRKKF